MTQETPQTPLVKLREDIQFSYQSYGNRPCYLLIDPVNEHYYQIGIAEYALLHQLNGETTLENALTAPDADQLNLQQALQIQQWLIASQLAHVQTKQGWQLLHPRTGVTQKLAQHANIMFLKIPLGSPDLFLERILPYVRWFYTPYFWLIWLLVCVSGLYQLVAQHERVISTGSQIFALHNAVWLFIAWALIKTLHEISHGLVCKYYGGYVHQAGIFLILFAPIGGYVNATASWRFTSKWQRIHVSAAGMFIELFIAGIAAWIWTYTEEGVLHYLSYNLILTASVATLLFNANPLMRFDGYYILIDLLNIPNLYAAGQRYIRYLNRHYLQGLPDVPPTQTLFIKGYGLSALVWRWLVVLGINIAAAYLWSGAGILLAAVGTLSWLIIPLYRFGLGIWKDAARWKILVRLSVILFSLSAMCGWAFTHLVWTQHITVPAVFDYDHATIIHTETQGFVKQVNVTAGDYVTAGQLLVVLENVELQAETTDLALQIKIHEAKRQKYFQEQALGKYQEELEKLTELQNKWREKTKQLEGLIILAPTAGIVVAEKLRELPDSYIKRGTEILTIANSRQLDVKISIPQQNIEAFQAQVGATVQLYRIADPLHAIVATLAKVNPSASQEIIHPALTAIAGGEIPVKAKSRREDNAQMTQTEQNPNMQYEHIEPRFAGVVHLPNDLQTVRVGETAQVVLTRPPENLGRLLWESLHHYISHLIEKNNNVSM
jgi:putative peptide zinc metalloprotease protein